MDIAKSVRVALASNNMKQNELSSKLGCSSAYVNQICLGNKVPSIQKIKHIAQEFGMKVSEFIALGRVTMNKKHLPAKVFNDIKKTFAEEKQNGFQVTVNARIVHDWLGVGRDFSTWIKNRIEKYKFKEHVDYCIVENLSSPESGSTKARSQVKKEYHCTPDMVKQLAMVENSDKGQLVRLYYLDCEIKAQEKQRQLEDRQSLKVEYRPMTDAIQEAHEEPKPYHYSNEADMINRIVLGMTSAKFKSHHEIGKNESVRDYMTELQMRAVVELQRANTVFITMGQDYDTRKQQLTDLFNKRFNQALIDEVNMLEE